MESREGFCTIAINYKADMARQRLTHKISFCTNRTTGKYVTRHFFMRRVYPTTSAQLLIISVILRRNSIIGIEFLNEMVYTTTHSLFPSLRT